VLEHAGDEHDHNASNHGHDSAATAHTNDDYNDAHERRLLIAKAGGRFVCCRHGPVAVSAFQRSSTEFRRHRSAHRTDSSYGEPLATVVTRSGFLSGRFRALRLFFFCLTHYGCDRLKRFGIPEIHQFYAHCVSPYDSNFFHAGPNELAFVGD